MIIHDVEQGTPEWYRLRLGKITGSRIKDVFKSDNLSLVDELIAEIETQEIDDEPYMSASMMWGKDLEPVACDEYSKSTGFDTHKIGFVTSKKNEHLGLSPDRFIFENGNYIGGLEVKCPDTKTHVKYLRMGIVPAEYRPQVKHYFLVAPGLEWVDFVSYDPRFTIKPMFTIRTYRNSVEAELIEMQAAIDKFWNKFQKYYNEIRF